MPPSASFSRACSVDVVGAHLSARLLFSASLAFEFWLKEADILRVFWIPWTKGGEMRGVIRVKRGCEKSDLGK